MQLPTPHSSKTHRPRSIMFACLVLVACLLGSHSPTASAAEAETRQQAISIAQQQNGGNSKVLGVSTEQDSHGQTVFAVKLLSNGRVRVFRIRKSR